MLLTIEKLIYGGDGLARLPAEPPPGDPRKDKDNDNDNDMGKNKKGTPERGKAVFVPFVLAGEKIEASLTEHKPGFARAKVETVVEPSLYRIQPSCPYFARCGGCNYQHASYEHQLEIKKEILRESLRRTARLELPFDIEAHPSPPWHYRNRSRLQVQLTPTFAAGYFKLASHELLAVEECPISSPLINRGIAALWQSGRAGKVPEGIREVEFFANADDSQLLVDVRCAGAARRSSVRMWAEEFRAVLPGIAGVVAFREPNPGDRKARAQEVLVAVGADNLIYQARRSAYRVSAGSFFQTNRHLTDKLLEIVTKGQSGQLALDLYAGAGLFSRALACDFRHIVCVEMSQTSSADLSYNLSSNGVAVRATAEQYLTSGENPAPIGTGTRKTAGKSARRAQVLNKPDLVVVDPPRSGLGERVTRLLASLEAPRLVYGSCDPSTLARDLITLLAAGYRVEQVHLVDLFPQTYHLESVVHLVR